MNARLRKVTRNRGQFPSEQAALKVLYLAVRNLEGFHPEHRDPQFGVVESARGAAPVLLPVRFPGPLAEPGVRLSAHRALHGFCRQAWFAVAQGVGIAPRYR